MPTESSPPETPVWKGGAKGWSNKHSAGLPVYDRVVGAVREPPLLILSWWRFMTADNVLRRTAAPFLRQGKLEAPTAAIDRCLEILHFLI